MAEKNSGAAGQQAARIDRRIRPTLYIAVGGSGKEVLLRLRRRILQALWNGRRVASFEEFPVVDFLYFDTYTGKAQEVEAVGGEEQATDPLRKLTELGNADCIQKRLDTDKYLKGRELERYPHVQAWLPDGELRAIRAEDGAGQVRPVSRLLFFDEAAQINALIKSKARGLLHNVGNEHLKRLDLDIEKEIQIVVVASLAGGTGAGAFLDMGFMCRSLQDPKPKAVNLVAIAGGAFSGLNDRVLANTYASCMELEYCMNASAGQPYVESWTDAVRCESVRPFNDVCFIDSKNLVDQSTGNRDFLFNMVADCLFVDLHDEALRGKRREDQVNQAQYKIEPYHPPMPAGIEANAMTFSRAYSSMGQVVLDTSARLDFEREIVSSSIEMVEAFFRIASSDKNNAPKPEDIDGFLKNQLSINSERLFDRFPDFIKTNKPSMPDFPLVDRLLYSRQVDLVARVKESVSKDINNIPTVQPDLDQWPARVSEIYENHRRSIIADVQSSAQDASLEQAIKTERRNLLEKLRDREQGLRKTVYMFLDSQERGGLYFTAGLIQAVQDRIEVTCDRLKTCSGQFDNIAQRIYNDYYTTAHANLQRSIKGGLFGRADERQALVYLEQISSSLSYLIEFMMRARACDEAIALLREVGEDLGHGSALGEGTNTGATGIMKEIEEGRATVRTMVSDLKQEVRLLDDARTSSNPFHTFVKGRRLGEIEVNQKDIAEWGARALGQYGGSQVLFQQLRDEKDRVGIINTLRGIAREEMRREEEKIQPVQSVLRDLDRTNRLRLFSEAVANALPWVNMDVERLGGDAFDSKSLSVFVAVENVAEFRKEFDDELKTALPARFQSKDIYYIDSGVRGRVVVFTELSGIPLHSLRPMHDDWRSAYEKRSTGASKLPLHNHRDTDRFSHPTARTLEDLENLKLRLSNYFRGICLGVLRRRDSGLYELDFGQDHIADWQSIGSERQIYMVFLQRQYDVLRKKIEGKEAELNASQMALYAANLDFLAYSAYAPRLERLEGGQETRQKGIAHFAALQARDSVVAQIDTQQLRKEIGLDPQAALRALAGCVAEWSDQIVGSLADTNGQEANLNPDDNPQLRAKDKRAINWVKASVPHFVKSLLVEPGTIDDEKQVLENKGSGNSVQHQSAEDAGGGMPPPLPMGGQVYYVGIDNQRIGPLKKDALLRLKEEGSLKPNTLTWRKGLGDWVACSEVDDLASLFDSDEPPSLPMS